jgi:YidC/Oxa1 family membrane protein insertase
MSDQKNLILAIALSILIILGFQVFYEGPRQQALQSQRAEETAAVTPSAAAPGVQAPAAGPTGPRDRAEVIAEGRRVRIDTPRLHGSFSATGGRIDDLTLAAYHVTPDPRSPEVALLSPMGSHNPYYAEAGWVPAPGTTVAVPDADTVWTVPENAVLTPARPVTMTWDNGAGVRFERVLSIDENYMFTITQRVVNGTDRPITLVPYGLVSRHGTPETLGFYILHEGPLGVFDGRLREFHYSDLKGKTNEFTSTGGWIGVTDKYWLVSVAAAPDAGVTGRFRHAAGVPGALERYQVDLTWGAVTIAPNATGENLQRIFAGAKQLGLLDDYATALGITQFDLSIDFGWFWFLTRPFSVALTWLGHLFGNFGVAILVFTVLVKAVFFPLANKSYHAMSKMKALQPKMQLLQERYKDDRQRLQQEMMALYKAEKVNPVSGCLPIIIQIPVFFALYKVLFVTIEMRHAPFFGWIQDLSAPEPTSFINLFGVLPFEAPYLFAHVGVWPIIMGITMYLQQKLNPQPPDPIQAKVFLALPFIFTFMLAAFPVGLVIYWAWNNALSILQQWVIMRRMGVKVT